MQRFIEKNKISSTKNYSLGFNLLKSHAINPVVNDILKYVNQNLESWHSDIIECCKKILKDRGLLLANLLITIVNQELAKQSTQQKVVGTKKNLFKWFEKRVLI
jgi:hypothetical protein